MGKTVKTRYVTGAILSIFIPSLTLKLNVMLPAQYSFLEQVGALPKLVLSSLNYLGLKEYPGTANNNPVIMNMAKDLGISAIYPNDEMA